MDRVNITQIARKLRVSKTTVSRVFNEVPNSRISAATRRRVLAAIRATGYAPNLSAQALAGSRTHVIGAMFINITNPFVSSFVGSVEELARASGYHVLLCNSRGNPAREVDECRMLRQRGVEGLILEHVGPGEWLRDLADGGYPTVLTGYCPEAPEVDYAGFDEVYGSEAATRALIESGRRRIAHIAGPAPAGAVQDRRSGYVRAVQASGLTVKPGWIVEAERYDDVESGRRAASKLLASDDRPDGIFCYDDLLAMGALSAVQAAGLRVPRDVAIIGYGNNYNTPWSVLPLPSVQLDTGKLGEEAGKLLLEKIERGSKAPLRRVKVKPYVVRGDLLR